MLANATQLSAQESNAIHVETPMVVFGYNDLGMHCMNSDYAEILILPPFNTLHAQVIRRGEEPEIMTEDISVRYFIPGNSYAADRSNFWKFPLLGTLPPDTGLLGAKLNGQMILSDSNDWVATGIPVVPTNDTGRENAYPLAVIEAWRNGEVVGRTRAVVPVSTEMSCHLCHNTAGLSVAADILVKHDDLHGTDLLNQRPVLCAACHSDNALGLPGEPGVSSLSAAMHMAHGPRVETLPIAEVCYACHPGIRTNCQRDIHLQNNVTCVNCHGSMEAVGDPSRRPWLDEPRCGNCHSRPDFEFEQPNTLYRNSVGHKQVHCSACHGSPHAIGPAVTETDNLQAILLQGHPGRIDTCAVCHVQTPGEAFFHKVDD